MFRSKKFLGIPLASLIIIMVVITILASGGGFVVAQYGFTQSQQATITVLGNDVKLYSDSQCLVPCDTTTTLNFGQVWPSQTSQVITLYARNQGAGRLYPKIQLSNVPNGIEVYEGTYGKIPTDSSWLNLYTLANFAWTTTGLTAQVGYEDLPANQNWVYTSVNTMASSNGAVKIDNEYITYASTDLSDRWKLCGLNRGMYGSTAVNHAHLAVMTFGNCSAYSSLDALEPNEIQPVCLSVKALDSAESGDLSFDVVVSATSEH